MHCRYETADGKYISVGAIEPKFYEYVWYIVQYSVCCSADMVFLCHNTDVVLMGVQSTVARHGHSPRESPRSTRHFRMGIHCVIIITMFFIVIF